MTRFGSKSQAARISGRGYTFPSNALGIKSLRLRLGDAEPATKGKWRDAPTFVFDFQQIGLDEQRSVKVSFEADGVTPRGKARDRHEVTVMSESWSDWLRHPLHGMAAWQQQVSASLH